MAIYLDENKHLEFSFGDNQEVLQYDSSRFYRKKIKKHLSGICAVDFLCRDRNQQKSFLIEVKDFGPLCGQDSKEHKGKEVAEKLATKIARKVFDTISGLHVATFSLQCDDEEKDYANRFFDYPLHIVFHYELPQNWNEAYRKKRMADLKHLLKNKLQTIDPSLQIEDLSKTRYWTVKRKP